MADERIECLVCEYMTLNKRGVFEICPICGWEDEGFLENPSELTFGPNGDLSLEEARSQFANKGPKQSTISQYKRIADLSTAEAARLSRALIAKYVQAVQNYKDLDIVDKRTLQSIRDMLDRLIQGVKSEIGEDAIGEMQKNDVLLKGLGAKDNAFYVDEDAPKDSWWFRLGRL